MARFKFKDLFQKESKTSGRAFVLIGALLLGCFFFVMTASNVTTKDYDVQIYDAASETIRSPITIENEAQTQRQRQEASQQIDDRYVVSSEITNAKTDAVKEIFSAISQADDADDPLDKRMEHVKDLLSESVKEELTDRQLEQLLTVPADERGISEKVFTDAMTGFLEDGVKRDEVQETREEMGERINYADVSVDTKRALHSLISFAIVQNASFDAQETASARTEAQHDVAPVMIRAGEIIVQEGQTITNDVYEEMKLVGLLNNSRNVLPLVGLGLFMALLTGILTYETVHTLKKRTKPSKPVLLFAFLLTCLSVLLLKLITIVGTTDEHYYLLLPAAFAAVLFRHLLGERFAIGYAIVYSILAGIIMNDEIPGSLNMEASLYYLFAQLAAVYAMRNVKDRAAMTKAFLLLVSIQIISVLLFLFFAFEKYAWETILLYIGFAVLSAILTVILVAGVLPFVEAGFGVLSETKLLALSKPNHPLLKKILTDAPGTYHHSIMVANLCEAACEAIGADGLLARVGAYYHDLGKTRQPQLFIENQMGRKNPHDRLSPRQSAEIIIRHPYDGAQMLKDNHFPKEIIDMAEQHHGTSLLKFFYYKEKEYNKDVKEESYRYPGPKPSTKETAVLSICDSVEAAVRSMKEPTQEKIRSLVDSIIKDKLMDGQLDCAPLTLQDLQVIKDAICQALTGIFHSRIEYPDEGKVKEAN
ncbi:HDIG domain-containing protein [Terribacillus saccharophilus]|uniref:HD family phosphohydrolase n=1 Tax=Terribacillus saccharophilus TaxID=361277 RepID=UPI003982CE92